MRTEIITIFLLSLAIFGLVSSRTAEELRVTLSNGSKLIGRYLRSNTGKHIKAFTNIPYAKPPLGSLRFKAPVPLDRWEGEYKATKDGVMCPQRNPFFRTTEDEGSEDCLHLNVYVPHTFEKKEFDLPVIVYFHGGGFMCGSGIGSLYDPGYFLDHDVVFVTANYRLGALGFLSTEDENCPGNFGLKDQVMVLKWIQQNIKQFGGDPNSVTISGSSAGGASVTYLMMSPLTEGLFAKGIALSGTNLAPWAQPAHKGVARKRVTQLAEYFDCHKPNDWAQTVECLRSVPAADITAASDSFFEFDTDPMVIFQPVVEPDLPGAFIAKHPREGHTGHSLKIPFITGITYDEGVMKSAPISNIPGLFDTFAANLDFALPIAFYYDHHDTWTQESITNQINEFYFNNDLTRERESNVTNLFGDGWFLAAMDSYLRLRLADKNASPTYVFLLTHKGAASYSEAFHGDPETFYGVSHADETMYLFPRRERLFANSLPTNEEEQLRKSFMQLFIDFAKTGNPTPASSALPKWESVSDFPVSYYRIGNLHFDGKPSVGMEIGGLFEERAEFWRKINAHSPAAEIKKDEL